MTQENVRSKTKEITGTIPCALSMRPAAVTPSDEVNDIVSECQTVNAPNINPGNSVRVKVLYRSQGRSQRGARGGRSPPNRSRIRFFKTLKSV